MSGIISYVKRIGVWLCIVIACEMIMIITMMLNKIPFAEIGYGIFISLFLLLILLAFDAMRYYRHYQKVKELEHTIMLSTDGMPENADLLENEYQKLLQILSDEYTGGRRAGKPQDRKICWNIMPCGFTRSRHRSQHCGFCFRIKMMRGR